MFVAYWHNQFNSTSEAVLRSFRDLQTKILIAICATGLLAGQDILSHFALSLAVVQLISVLACFAKS